MTNTDFRSVRNDWIFFFYILKKLKNYQYFWRTNHFSRPLYQRVVFSSRCMSLARPAFWTSIEKINFCVGLCMAEANSLNCRWQCSSGRITVVEEILSNFSLVPITQFLLSVAREMLHGRSSFLYHYFLKFRISFIPGSTISIGNSGDIAISAEKVCNLPTRF